MSDRQIWYVERHGSELPLFRPHPSQVCAARARRQFLDRRGGPTDDFIRGRRLMSDLLGMCQLATSSTGCANPTPLLRPLYPLPHHHRPPSACSRAGSSGWPARPVYALVPCCQPELPITMLDDAPPQRAVSASPRAIGRDRALACLVRAFRRGEFCSRSPDRIGVAAGPSWAGPTAPIPSEAVGRAVRRRLWAACGRQRRERRSTAAEHAARGGMRRR